jgi:hypothetical protein
MTTEQQSARPGILVSAGGYLWIIQCRALLGSWRGVVLIAAWDALWSVPLYRWPAGADPLFAIIVLAVQALSALATLYWLPYLVWRAVRRGWPRWRKDELKTDAMPRAAWVQALNEAHRLADHGSKLCVMRLAYSENPWCWIVMAEVLGHKLVFLPVPERLEPAWRRELKQLLDRWWPVHAAVVCGGLAAVFNPQQELEVLVIVALCLLPWLAQAGPATRIPVYWWPGWKVVFRRRNGRHRRPKSRRRPPIHRPQGAVTVPAVSD